MRARALQLSARLEARLSGAHTRPGHGAVPCARRECRCAARGRPRRQEGHLRPLATAWGARAQREHVVCGVAALGPRPPARRSGGAQLPLRAGGHASAATAITSGAGRAPSVAPGASPPQLALGAAPETVRAAREAPKGCCCSASDPVCTAQPGADAPGRTAVGLARLAPLPGAAQGAPGPPPARASRLVRAQAEQMGPAGPPLAGTRAKCAARSPEGGVATRKRRGLSAPAPARGLRPPTAAAAGVGRCRRTLVPPPLRVSCSCVSETRRMQTSPGSDFLTVCRSK